MREKIKGFLGLDISDTQKNILIILLFIAIFTGCNCVHAESLKIEVFIDGEEVNFPDAQPFINNSRTLVPVRFVAENLGADVDWQQKEKRVDINKDNKNIQLWIGRENYLINNATQKMDTTPLLKQGRTFVPLRFVAEGLETRVEWKQAKGIGYVHIFTKGQSENEIKEIMNKVAGGNKQDKTFIEPELEVVYTTNEPYEFNYFILRLKNEDAYEGKNYTFKTECISHPELNKWLSKGFKAEYNKVDLIKRYTLDTEDMLNNLGRIYELGNLTNKKDIKTNKPIVLKEGEKIKYKITISNGKTTKTYNIETEFRNKKFN